MKSLASAVLVLVGIFLAHGGEDGKLRISAQDQIPIRGCYLPEAFV